MKPPVILLLCYSVVLSMNSSAAEMSPETQAWAAACQTSPPPKYTQAVDRLIGRMKAEKVWEPCGLLLFFAAHEGTPAAFNLKGCPKGELKGATEHIPGRGLKGNGTDAWFETNLHLQDIPGFTLQNHGLYAYAADDVPGAFTIVGASGGGPAYAIRPRNLANLGVWTGSLTQLQANPILSGVGLSGYSRFSETEGLWAHDEKSGPLALTPAATVNSTLRVLRHGGATAYFPGGVSFVWAGAALTALQAKTLGSLFDECLATLGTLESIRVAPKPAYAGPGAFKREQINDVVPAGVKIFMLTAPPASDAADEREYYYFPLTYAVCRPWTAKASTSTKVQCIELIWSDRALGPKPGVISDVPFKKGNDTCGVITLPSGKGTGRTEFDSFELAIGATLGRTAYSAGLKPFGDERCVWEGKPMGWCDWLELFGYDVSPWRTLAAKSANVETDPIFVTDAEEDTGGSIVHRAWAAAHADEVFTRPAITGGTILVKRNLVILGPGRAIDDPKFAGFIMDLEHADGRSPELFARSMEMWAHIIHSIKKPDGSPRFLASCTAHELDGGTGKLAGWDASTGHRVYEALDYTSVNLTIPNGRDINARVETQLDVLRGPKRDLPIDLHKILIQINLGMGGGQLPMSDAMAVHEWLKTHPGLGALFVAPVGANLKVPADDVVSRLRATIFGFR